MVEGERELRYKLLNNNVKVPLEPTATQLAVDNSSSREDDYSKLPDNDLTCQSSGFSLPDRGERLRLVLKHLEAESKRRRMSFPNRFGAKHPVVQVKGLDAENDDDKCKGATQIDDGSTCASSTRTPLAPTSKWTFASRYLSKSAEDREKHRAAKHHKKLSLWPKSIHGGDDGDIPNSKPQVALQTQLLGVTGQGTKRKGVVSPTACPCQKKPNNTIAADEIAEGSTVLPNVVPQKDATIAKPSSIQTDFSIPECLSILRRMPEVEEGGVLFLYATMLFMKPVEREMFVCLEKDDVRLKWLGYLMERDAQGRAIS